MAFVSDGNFNRIAQGELAVHKKKVEDVRHWLDEAFTGGPSGKLRKYRVCQRIESRDILIEVELAAYSSAYWTCRDSQDYHHSYPKQGIVL